MLQLIRITRWQKIKLYVSGTNNTHSKLKPYKYFVGKTENEKFLLGHELELYLHSGDFYTEQRNILCRLIGGP